MSLKDFKTHHDKNQYRFLLLNADAFMEITMWFIYIWLESWTWGVQLHPLEVLNHFVTF